jgi:hypothetical protein
LAAEAELMLCSVFALLKNPLEGAKSHLFCTDFRHALALEPQNKAALAAERRIQKHLR